MLGAQCSFVFALILELCHELRGVHIHQGSRLPHHTQTLYAAISPDLDSRLLYRLITMDLSSIIPPEPPSQLHELIELIEQKGEKLAELRRIAGFSESTRTLAEEAHVVEELLSNAQEEWRRVDRERADVLAQYEACQHNKVQHTQADEFRKAIVTVEAEIIRADTTIAGLEKQLHTVSASYKNERERRMLMLGRFKSMVDELRGVVTKKIDQTIQENEVDARMLLRMIAEISRERETEVTQWEKYSKEMVAIVSLKRTRTEELQKESELRVKLLAEAKSQEIRELVEKCEAERGAITNDIQVLQEVNRKQLEQLRAVRLAGDRSGRLEKEPISARQSNVPAEKFLMSKLHESEQSKEELELTLRQLTSDRQKLQTTMGQLKQEMENDAAKHAKVLGHLDAAMANERFEIAALEKDNRQLRDLCDTLAATLTSGYIVH